MEENQKKTFKVNKTIVITIIVAILLIITNSITYSVIKSKRRTNAELGNISNMGLAASNDEGVFYNKYEEGIVKVKGLEESKITNETAYAINLVGDTIYYLSVGDTSDISIKTVKTNGSEKKTIKSVHTSISKMYIENGYIYYATNDNNGGIAKLNIDGSNENTIISSEIRDFEVVDGKIYFTNKSGDLFVATSTGIDIKKITLENTSIKEFQVKEEWIYYYNEDKNALYKVKVDGTSNQLLSEYVKTNIFNVSKDAIYFFDEENKKIDSINFEGNKFKEIVSISTNKTKINVVGDTIYYLDASNNESKIYQMYRVKTNGGNAKTIEY